MRLCTAYFKNHARVPQNTKKVPFKEVFPLKLQNRIIGGSKGIRENNCLYEMSLMFACLKDNDFENNLCENQIKRFQECVIEFEKNKKHQKMLQEVGVPTPDTTKFTDTQLTYLLKKYPTV